MPIYLTAVDDETGEEQIMKCTGYDAEGNMKLTALTSEELIEYNQATESGYKGKHPSIPLLYEDVTINIDSEIADLVQLLWRNGIKTSGSCQGDEEKEARIGFADLDSANACLQLLTLGHKSPLPVPTGWSDGFTRSIPGKWNVQLGADGACGVALIIGWQFPNKDIKMITSKLQEYEEYLKAKEA